MKDKRKHLDENMLIEYFYQAAPFPEQIEEHLKGCLRCKREYQKIKQDMEWVSEWYKRDFWDVHRQRIMSELEGIQGTKRPLWARWGSPVFVTTVIAFIIIGIYFGRRVVPPQYTDRDVREEIVLNRVSEMIDEPITSSLDFLDFDLDFKDKEEAAYGYSFEKLDLFGYWPELENMNDYEKEEV